MLAQIRNYWDARILPHLSFPGTMRHYGHICPCGWTPYQRPCLFYLTSDPAVHPHFFRGLRVMKQWVSGDE